MSQSHIKKDKLLKYRIGAPPKPFIDKNLQIQFPRWEPSDPPSPCLNPIYPHYLTHPSSNNHYFQTINEEELSNAMKEAKSSYQAWKKMQRKLKEMIEIYSPPQ